MVAAKVGDEVRRERDWDRILDDIMRGLAARKAARAVRELSHDAAVRMDLSNGTYKNGAEPLMPAWVNNQSTIPPLLSRALAVGGGIVALCDRCGEEITLANALDRAGDIDRRRHRVMVADIPRSLTATHWRIFMLLYRHRGDVVYNDRIHAGLSEGRDRPSAELIRERMRQLRKVLVGSRYQIINYRSLGYEIVLADASDASPTGKPARPRGKSRSRPDEALPA
jgi:DNA-binding winged helix-turn-helix (wHTH) protein